MKNIMTVVIISAIAGALSGCYTVKGVGEDLSATGHTVQNVATATKPAPYHHHNN